MNRIHGLSIVRLIQELEYLDDAASRESLLSEISPFAEDRDQSRMRSEDLKVQAQLIREQMKEFYGIFEILAS